MAQSAKPRKRVPPSRAGAGEQDGAGSINERLTSFLLSSRSFDSIPWDTFKRFFPEELRSSPEVRRLHTLLSAQRKEIRQRVKANIDTSFPKGASTAPAAVVTAGRALPLSLADATGLLERREAELTSELDSAERDAKRHRRQAEKQERELATVQIARPSTIMIPDLAPLLQLLEDSSNSTTSGRRR